VVVLGVIFCCSSGIFWLMHVWCSLLGSFGIWHVGFIWRFYVGGSFLVVYFLCVCVFLGGVLGDLLGSLVFLLGSVGGSPIVGYLLGSLWVPLLGLFGCAFLLVIFV